MLRKLVSLFVFFAILFPVIMTAASSTAFGQKLIKRCYYTCSVPRPVRTGCNSCARLKIVEEKLSILENKKPEERTQDYSAERIKLQRDFDDLKKLVEVEVARLDKRIDDLGSSFEEKLSALAQVTTTKLAETNTRVEVVENRVSTLESKCGVVAVQDQKGKLKLFDSCTNSPIKTGGGLSTGAKIGIGLGITGGAIGIACLFGVKGLCRAGRVVGVPPGGTTGPSF